MAEGEGKDAVPMAAVDSSDWTNPKRVCHLCGTQNDITASTCVACTIDLLSPDIDNDNNDNDDNDDDNNNNNSKQPSKKRKKKSMSNINFFDKNKNIAAADPDALSSQSQLTPIAMEGMLEIEPIENFLDDAIDEGRHNNRHNNHANNDRNIQGNGNNNNNANHNGNEEIANGNRPLFTTLLVIYWLYFLVWFLAGIVLTSLHTTEMIGLALMCLMLPCAIILILITSISCLNQHNINHINHMNELDSNAKKRYKLQTIVIVSLLGFSVLLRSIWWIYIINFFALKNEEKAGKNTDAGRECAVMIALMCNEIGMVILFVSDHIRMAYYERNQQKQGIFGIIDEPYPCLIAFCSLLSVQLWCLVIGNASNINEMSEECSDENGGVKWLFECHIYLIQFLIALPILCILMSYVYKRKYSDGNGDGFDDDDALFLNENERKIVFGMSIWLAVMTLCIVLSIFVAFETANTWIHLLLLPQLFAVMWALTKLRKLKGRNVH